MRETTGRIVAICAGRVRPLEGLGRIHQTAFVKEPVVGPVAVGPLGIAGDEHIYHAHGGPDQARCRFACRAARSRAKSSPA